LQRCDNIFINGALGLVKIGDLGLATMKETDRGMSIIGTPEFMAPEFYDQTYTEKVDIWAFGMSLLEMVTLDYPYSECQNAAQIYRAVYMEGRLPASLETVENVDVREFIRCCLRKPDTRPSAAELLEHDFLKSADDDVNVLPSPASSPHAPHAVFESPPVVASSASAAAAAAKHESGGPAAVAGAAVSPAAAAAAPPAPHSNQTAGQSQLVKLIDGDVSSIFVAQTLPLARPDQQQQQQQLQVQQQQQLLQQQQQQQFEQQVPGELPNQQVSEGDIVTLHLYLTVDGRTQEIEFKFNMAADDPETVAKEMVDECRLPIESLPDIVRTINDRVQLLRAPPVTSQPHEQLPEQQPQPHQPLSPSKEAEMANALVLSSSDDGDGDGSDDSSVHSSSSSIRSTRRRRRARNRSQSSSRNSSRNSLPSLSSSSDDDDDDDDDGDEDDGGGGDAELAGNGGGNFEKRRSDYHEQLANLEARHIAARAALEHKYKENLKNMLDEHASERNVLKDQHDRLEADRAAREDRRIRRRARETERRERRERRAAAKALSNARLAVMTAHQQHSSGAALMPPPNTANLLDVSHESLSAAASIGAGAGDLGSLSTSPMKAVSLIDLSDTLPADVTPLLPTELARAAEEEPDDGDVVKNVGETIAHLSLKALAGLEFDAKAPQPPPSSSSSSSMSLAVASSPTTTPTRTPGSSPLASPLASPPLSPLISARTSPLNIRAGGSPTIATSASVPSTSPIHAMAESTRSKDDFSLSPS
jgi:serine/threonine protein kinase